MRTRIRGKKALLFATIALAVAPSVSSMAARSQGAIRLLDPVTDTAYSSLVPFAWDFDPGTKVKTNSIVYLQASTDGYRWRTISGAARLPIRNGAFMWDASEWPEGTYMVRSVVQKTLIASKVGPIIIDRTAPRATITRPSEGNVIVEDLAELSSAVVVGTTTLEADTFDAGSGVSDVEWFIDGNPVGTGNPYEYNFSLNAGPHTLKAIVSDHAGNDYSTEISVIAGPGPSLVAGELPVDPDALPIDDPTLPEDVPPGGLPDDVPGDVPPGGPPDGVPPEGVPGDVPPGGVPDDVPPGGLPPTGLPDPDVPLP